VDDLPPSEDHLVPVCYVLETTVVVTTFLLPLKSRGRLQTPCG